jgi:hypothetical protein
VENRSIDDLYIEDLEYRLGVMEVDPLLPTPLEKAIIDPLSGITKAAPEAYKEMGLAFARGGVKGLFGAPMDIVGLAVGLGNMLTDDPEEKGNLAQFAEGYGAVPFTSEDIGEMLEKAGWKKSEDIAESAELIGEIGGGTASVVSGVKKVLKKDTDNIYNYKEKKPNKKDKKKEIPTITIRGGGAK